MDIPAFPVSSIVSAHRVKVLSKSRKVTNNPIFSFWHFSWICLRSNRREQRSVLFLQGFCSWWRARLFPSSSKNPTAPFCSCTGNGDCVTEILGKFALTSNSWSLLRNARPPFFSRFLARYNRFSRLYSSSMVFMVSRNVRARSSSVQFSGCCGMWYIADCSVNFVVDAEEGAKWSD